MSRLVLVLALCLLALPAFAQQSPPLVPGPLILPSSNSYQDTGSPVADIFLEKYNYNPTMPNGFVSSIIRLHDINWYNDIGEEWGFLSIMDNYSPAGHGVAGYFQANSHNAGWTAALLGQTYCNNYGGTCVGEEIDAGGVPGTNPVGIDVVNTGNMSAAYRAPCSVPALVSPTDLSTYIEFPCAGGIQIWSHGSLVATW